MVDAAKYISPPFTMFPQQGAEIAIRRKGSILRISCKTKHCEVIEDTLENQGIIRNTEHKPVEFYGIFGTMDLPGGSYLILINRAALVGEILKCQIFRVDSLLFVPLNAPYEPYTQAQQDKPFIEMIQNLQQPKSFYFSYQIDLTKRVQKTLQEVLAASASGTQQDLVNLSPNSVNYIPEYAFNHKMLSDFMDLQCAPFRTPCIHGFVAIKKISFKMDFALISRRDCRRPGRRFITRGLDSEGAAANFAETEHILQVQTGATFQVAAHTQIRGSIPLIWQMKPTMQWSPSVNINPNFDESFAAAKHHLKETNAQYSKQYFVNLIDKKSSQLRIGTKMGEIITQLKDTSVKYTWFDFHGECKNMKWENLSKLITIVDKELNEWGHFICELKLGLDQRSEINSDTCKIKSVQEGVMRTNCMDCLDRTNVVQGVFSRKVLHQQLFSLEQCSKPTGAPFEKFQDEALERTFRDSWTDNADAISILYTGTPALKTDFTRTGKRTYLGALNDGKNSLTRYYINNFCDGYNHDCLDISQKRLTHSSALVTRSQLTPLKITMLTILAMMYAASHMMNTYVPYPTRQEELIDELRNEQDVSIFKVQILHNLVYLLVFMTGVSYIFRNGKHFVDDASRAV